MNYMFAQTSISSGMGSVVFITLGVIVFQWIGDSSVSGTDALLPCVYSW